MESAPESCILCNARNRKLLIEKDSWKVYQCINCGLGFLDPRPSAQELQRLYGEGYFVHAYDRGIDPDTPELKKRLSQETHRVRFFRHIKRKGRVLDIGCGNGYFLAACRSKGYDVQGLDISDWAAKYAFQKLGLPVITSEINVVQLPAKSFDIITMWHFLEHAQDPIQTILKVISWLKRDGILIIDVPNYMSTDARKTWENWVGWSLPYHFYHFTPQTLKRMLETCGFNVIKTKDYHSDSVKMKLRRIPMLRPFARLIARMYSGTSIAVVAKLKD